jgi:hypothetical protein
MEKALLPAHGKKTGMRHIPGRAFYINPLNLLSIYISPLHASNATRPGLYGQRWCRDSWQMIVLCY